MIERLEILSYLRERGTRPLRFDLQQFASAYDNVVIADTPYFYLRLDETSGTSAADVSGNSRSGSYVGTAGTDYSLNDLPGGSGPIAAESQGAYKGLNTNASHGVLTANPAVAAGSAWSVELWVYVPALPGQYYTLFGYNSTHRLLLKSDGTLLYQSFNSTSYNTAATVSIGAWHHIVLVSGGNGTGTAGHGLLTAYIDGVADTTPLSAPTSTTGTDWNAAFYFGQYDTSTNYKLVGDIGRSAFYAAALSSTRILAHYNQGLAVVTTYDSVVLADSPSWYYRLDEPSGTIADDLSTHAANGSYVGTLTTDYKLNQTPGPIAAETQGAYQGLATTASHGVLCGALTYAAGTSWSLELWVKIAALPAADYTLIGFSGSRRLMISSTGTLVYQTYSTLNLTTATTISTGAWHHVVLVATGNGGANSKGLLQCYIDGSLDANHVDPTSNTATDFNGTPYLGQYDTSTNLKLTGFLGRCAAYPTALSGTRITAHYTTGTGAGLSASPASITLANPTASATSTVSGGTTPYSILTAPNAALATASIVGSTGVVTVTGANGGPGSTSVVVQDNAGKTKTIPIVVDAAMTASPLAVLVGNAAGAQFITASKPGYTGLISAVSSATSIAAVSGNANGPTVTFQVLRAYGANGTTNITITAADGDSVVVPFTVQGPLSVNSISQPYQGSITVNVSEAAYAGVFNAAVTSGTATLNASSGQPTSAGGIVAFVLTWPSGASGEATIVFTDDHGGTLPITLNVSGTLVVSATAITFPTPTSPSVVLAASESADPNLITAYGYDTAIASVTAGTNAAGNATWTIAPVALGATTVTVDDGHGGTQNVVVNVTNQVSFSPSAFTFIDPKSAPQSFTPSGGSAPYTYEVDPAIASVDPVANTITPLFSGTATITATDGVGNTGTASVTIGSILSVTPTGFTFLGAGTSQGLQILGGRPPYTVSSSATGIATVTGTGPYLVNSLAVGQAIITVTDADGEQAFALINVQPGPIDPTPVAVTDARVVIFDAKFATVITRTAHSEITSLQYEDQPAGCASASFQTTLTWEQVFQRGYYLGRNGVEISTLDDYTRRSSLAAATKIYVSDTRPYDTTVHPDTPQIAIDDGVNYTARIPVTGVGSDANGPYITVGTPLAGAGNPATLPAYGAGAMIFRRRWSGRLAGRDQTNTSFTKMAFKCVGNSIRLNDRVSSDAFNQVDCGTAIFAAINKFTSDSNAFPDLVVSQSNFPSVGVNYTGTRQDVPLSSVIGDMLSNITGDTWAVRVGHDRVVRLLKLYTSVSNSYTHMVVLSQKSPYYAPAQVASSDQDISQLANAVLVTGDTNASTNQPASGIVSDPNSIAEYLQIDAAPVSVTGLSTDAQCAQAAQGILNQRSQTRATNKFLLSVRHEQSAAALYSPIGLQTGDAVEAVDAVTVGGFGSSMRVPNLIDDSNLALASLTWTRPGWANSPGWTIGATAGAFGTSSWRLLGAVGDTTGVNAWVYSQPAYVPPGAQVTLSATFNLTAGGAPTSTTVKVYLYDPTLTTSYGSISGTFGSNLRPSATIQLPANVSAFVAVLIYSGTLKAGATVDVSAFDVRIGPSAGYVDNLSAPAIYGLPTSVKTTIQASRDRVQEIDFSAIEPDWNAQLAELKNGIATQLRNNTETPTQIDAYCLSTEGQNYSYAANSLVLSLPEMFAIFTPGSPIMAVPATQITLAPNATTWVWLTPSLSWLQQTSYASLPGSILLGYFSTSAVGILGDFPKAPIGVVKVGNPFPGGIHQIDGSWTNIDGEATAQTTSMGAMMLVEVTGRIARGSLVSNSGLVFGANALPGIFGPSNGGYGILMNYLGNVDLVRWNYDGSATTLAALPTVGVDRDYHIYRVSVMISASNNTFYVEGAFDNNFASAFDISQNLTAGTIDGSPVTAYTAGNDGSLIDFAVRCSLQTSTPLSVNVPNALPWTSNATLWVNWPTSSSSLTYYLDDGSGNGVDPLFTNPNWQNFTAPHQGHYNSVQSGGVSVTGLPTATGSKVYFLIWYKQNDATGVNGTGWHVTTQTSGPFTVTQIQAAYADGGGYAILATINATTSAFVIGGSGSVFHGTGGGGKQLL